MKKFFIALLFILGLSLSLGQGAALAATSCKQILNTGAATTDNVFWEYPQAFYGWSGGVITNNMYFNGCGQTATLKVNVDDWLKLKKEGKLNGLRYISKSPKGVVVKQVIGGKQTNIPQEKFFDSTTVVLKGNK